VILDSGRQRSRNQRYPSVQQRFRTWCAECAIDPQAASAVAVINFLAQGRKENRWANSTVRSYRSAILDMLPDPAAVTSDPAFKEFFQALGDLTIRSFDRPTYDISTVISTFRRWGDNPTLAVTHLTQKLCWLLAMCGFLRPSDVARIDDDRTECNNNALKLVIVAPKEKRGGCRVEKVVHIHHHTDDRLCPVSAYRAYHARFDGPPDAVCHSDFAGVTYRPLIRSLRNPKEAIGAERIAKHINAVMGLIPLPAGAQRPKARALGSTRAAQAGASWTDILTQGFWASTGIFDTETGKGTGPTQ